MEEFDLVYQQIRGDNEQSLIEQNIMSKCKMEAISSAIIKIGIKKEKMIQLKIMMNIIYFMKILYHMNILAFAIVLMIF